MCLQHTGLHELEIELDQGMSAYEAITFTLVHWQQVCVFDLIVLRGSFVCNCWDCSKARIMLFLFPRLPAGLKKNHKQHNFQCILKNGRNFKVLSGEKKID